MCRYNMVPVADIKLTNVKKHTPSQVNQAVSDEHILGFGLYIPFAYNNCILIHIAIHRHFRIF